MATIYTIANRKGGVGKTTTAHALGAGFALRGFKTLLIDFDSQGNLSQSCGADMGAPSAAQLLRREISAPEAVQPIKGNLDLIRSGASLARADIDVTETGKEYRLKEALAELLPVYDFVVIDTPPALGVLTVNALTAADRLIVPALADYFSLKALEDLQSLVEMVRRYTNPDLITDGILITRQERSIHSRELSEIIAETAESFQTQLYEARISKGVAANEAQTAHRDIFDYAPHSKVAAAYNLFVCEVLERLNKAAAR